jgi:hypothetical protein
MFNPEETMYDSLRLLMRASIIAEAVLAAGLKEGIFEDPNRKAFILALQRKGETTPLGAVKIGATFPDEKFRLGCWELAQEKVERQFRLGHVSSAKSQKPEERKYAGAIVLPIKFVTWGIGVSGLRAPEDEAAAVLIGMYTFKIPIEDRRIYEILQVSNNYDLNEKLWTAVMKHDDGYYAKYIHIP